MEHALSVENGRGGALDKPPSHGRIMHGSTFEVGREELSHKSLPRGEESLKEQGVRGFSRQPTRGARGEDESLQHRVKPREAAMRRFFFSILTTSALLAAVLTGTPVLAHGGGGHGGRWSRRGWVSRRWRLPWGAAAASVGWRRLPWWRRRLPRPGPLVSVRLAWPPPVWLRRAPLLAAPEASGARSFGATRSFGARSPRYGGDARPEPRRRPWFRARSLGRRWDGGCECALGARAPLGNVGARAGMGNFRSFGNTNAIGMNRGFGNALARRLEPRLRRPMQRHEPRLRERLARRPEPRLRWAQSA